MRAFRDLQGKAVTLGRFLGRGGEGAVYSVPSRTGLVAKIYARTPDGDTGRKLGAMVQLGTEVLRSLAAWPQDLLLDEGTGNVVGFLMPKVEAHRGIHALYGPTTRKKDFPSATWAFLARAARNVATTVDLVHRNGHVIGDVNEGNVVVSSRATVRLIDCDSFQISHLGHTYPCRVGVPLYTPPELQGQKLENVVRTPDHDRFGLAVLVFQLLFMGRHPFAGLRPDPIAAAPLALRARVLALGRQAARRVLGRPLADGRSERAITVGMAIREGLFAFGAEAARQGWAPPPFSLRLTEVSPSIARLFERAFGNEAVAGEARPTAKEWVNALDELEGALETCARNPGHALVKASGPCPWCRIESGGGPSFFVLPPRTAPSTRRREATPRVAAVATAQVKPTQIDVGVLADRPGGAHQGQTVQLRTRRPGMIAIDLGTSYSRVAVLEGGTPRVIPNQEGATRTPSVVAFTGTGDCLVGQKAMEQGLADPRHTVAAVHRLIGRKAKGPEIRQARSFLPHPIAEAPNGDVYIRIRDRNYSPVEISSFILAKLKRAAEHHLNQAVGEATITVPAAFDASQRQAIKDAGRIAGLEVVRILNQPTAAAVAHGVAAAKTQCLAVYGLGGGTFDISILEVGNGLCRVLATGGDTCLGGEDFDRRIVDWLIAVSLHETGIDLRRDRMALQRLKQSAEKAKRELSTGQQARILLPFLTVNASGQTDLMATLTREKYESMTQDLLDRTLALCRRCLTDANVRPDQVDEVLLVGGQSRDPRVANLLQGLFGRKLNRVLDPDETVAAGAAIHTGIVQGTVRDVVLQEVTPCALGLETQGGGFSPLIERNSPLPARNKRVLTTSIDDQTWVGVHVLQGVSDWAAHNKSLANIKFTNLKPAPKGVTRVGVSFDIDVNGIVSVSVLDPAYRGRLATFHLSGGLSEQQVDDLAIEALAREAVERSTKDEAVVGHLAEHHGSLMSSADGHDGPVTAEERHDDVVRRVGARLLEDGLTVEERESLIRLRGLLAETTGTLRAMEGNLTTGERDRVRQAIERCGTLTEMRVHELRECVKGLERALRLLKAVRL